MTNDGKQAGRPPATTPSGAAGGGDVALANTRLAEDIATAEMKERYDAHCKRLLSHKPILARIMKGCMEEYRDCPAEEIESLIEGTPAAGTFPLHGGQPQEGQLPVHAAVSLLIQHLYQQWNRTCNSTVTRVVSLPGGQKRPVNCPNFVL